MRRLFMLLIALWTASCGGELAQTAKATLVDISSLPRMTDDEFCEFASYRFNFEGPKTDAVHEEALRRRLYERTGRKCGLKLSYRIALHKQKSNGSQRSKKYEVANTSGTYNSKKIEPVDPKPMGYSFAQAEAICKPKARLAGQQNKQSYKPRKDSFSGTCRENFFGNLKCTGESYELGGSWAGANKALQKTLLYNTAYNATFDSCMAEYGFF